MDIITDNDNCGIYIFTNKTNGKQYVGKDISLYKDKRKKQHLRNAFDTKSDDYDSYFHRAIRKYGKDDWEYHRGFCAEEDLIDTEIHYIALLKTFGEGYNMTAGGEGVLGLKHTEESKEKIRQANLGKTLSDDTKEKLREANLGKNLSEEHKEKIRKTRSREPRSEETKKKISEGNKGKKVSDEAKERMRAAKLGTKLSDETKRKISETKKRNRREGQ